MASTICKPGTSRRSSRRSRRGPAPRSSNEYAIAKKKRSDYAIDHLVPLDLGGTNGLTNLWPIPLKGTATPHRKAVVDAAVYKSMCAGFISLATAQGLSMPPGPASIPIWSPRHRRVKQLWFWSETGGIEPHEGLSSTVSNPGLEPISGVKMSWNALTLPVRLSVRTRIPSRPSTPCPRVTYVVEGGLPDR